MQRDPCLELINKPDCRKSIKPLAECENAPKARPSHQRGVDLSKLSLKSVSDSWFKEHFQHQKAQP